MLKKQNETKTFSENTSNSFKRGIFRQMELFKFSCNGNEENNWNLMCDCIENIKSDIKHLMIENDYKKDLILVEKVIFWYRTIESRHVKVTEDGPMVVLPSNIRVKTNKNKPNIFNCLFLIILLLYKR